MRARQKAVGVTEALAKLIAGAKSPVVIVGGPGWSADVQTRLQAWAKKFDMPVVTAFQVCRLVAVLLLANPVWHWMEARRAARSAR